jgi:ketosteroid isomerase-like protein
LSDELEIRGLIDKWADAINHRVPRLIKDIYAADGTLGVHGWIMDFKGVDEIVGFLAGLLGHWDVIFHAVYSGRVSVDGDSAVGSWYMTEFGRYRDGYEVFVGGRWSDKYIRTDSGWRIYDRRFQRMFRRVVPSGSELAIGAPLADLGEDWVNSAS